MLLKKKRVILQILTLHSHVNNVFRVCGGSGARGLCMWCAGWRSSHLKASSVLSEQTLSHLLSGPPSTPPAAFLSSASANFSFLFTLLFVSSPFFSATKSPAQQAAETAAGPEHRLESGQLHQSRINDPTHCFVNSPKCVNCSCFHK